MNIPILAAEFPFKAIQPCPNSLELVEGTMRYQGTLNIAFTVRLVWWRRNDNESYSIDDVLEQEVALPTPGPGLERYQAAILAFRQLVGRILVERPKGFIMPSDLFRPLASALSLAKPTNVANYRHALAVPSRLGRYLEPGLDYWNDEAW